MSEIVCIQLCFDAAVCHRMNSVELVQGTRACESFSFNFARGRSLNAEDT